MRIVLCKGQILGPISGADETLVTYATELQKAGHSVVVLLMYLPLAEDRYYQRLLSAGVPVSWIASKLAQASLDNGRQLAYKMFELFPSSKSLIRRRAQRVVTGMATRYAQQCREFFEQQNADLIHIITPDPSAMVMIRAGYEAGVPVIYQELGLPYHPPDFESYYAQFTSVLPLCTEVAALSPTLAEHCREKLPTSKVLSVLPIMSDEVVNGSTTERHVNGCVTFGFAARMEVLKGPMVLMEAFGAAYHREKSVCLKIAGDGSEKEKVAARARSLQVDDRYQYGGVYTHPDERQAFMHDLDVFVMPSFTEGTPNSIIEAMANGKPIIASAVGGIPDMLDIESGILVAPGDSAALAEAMIRLAQDPQRRARMGKAARARYQKMFSPKAVVPLMLETYRRVAAAKNGNANNGNGHENHHPWRSSLEKVPS
ncbi:MAG TPA: glycosyltransferase family 4 protein [Pyrinomonadaceae bacterium]|jgi:glycosyltransferase involved in cell wall biosynthesis|nr:glycosyltransferase family 4 protein [Pyrinomonadaceae bacterium]